MRHSQLRAFDAVAREGSFSRAAQLLKLTPPAVTIQVRSLEETYGLTLFHRSGGQALLTEDGQQLFNKTRQFFLEEEKIQEHLSASSALERGHLKIAADGPHVALPLIAAFRERYPGVTLSVSLGNAESVRQDILAQRGDVGITANCAGDDRLILDNLSLQSMVALVPAEHSLAKSKRIGLAELMAEQLILRERGSNTRRVLDLAVKQQGLAYEEMLELGSREAVREAVAVGLGIGFLFEHEVWGDNRTHALLIDELRDSNRDMVICLKSQIKRRSVEAFVSLARETAGAS
ncbi:LysR substrate-binding domain-containing protein [Kiloniella laminariae]|uniref:LysR substrate-binding domain-containing protein n=1 Tax=Kiloniella laminariae TaxID=454162 RepID=A0ABT4LJU1_9PROT|nr:LysR substrate-binding domain-containing protein [Kiloniella laminariae]MCZ4281373.1 LysR substrate-binding domain-containing protein [Kiloniella laminariae]